MFVGFLNLHTFLGHFKVFCFCFKKYSCMPSLLQTKTSLSLTPCFAYRHSKKHALRPEMKVSNFFFPHNLWVMSAQIILLNIAFPDFLPPSQLLSSLLPSIKLHDKKEESGKNIRETEIFAAPAF